MNFITGMAIFADQATINSQNVLTVSLKGLLTRAIKSITIAWTIGAVFGPFLSICGHNSAAQSQVAI